MKINWGTGIVLSFILFIAFILVMVLQMSLSKRADHELVTSSYYKKELAFQNEIDAQENAAIYKLNWQKTESNLILTIEDWTASTSEITVSFYRPSNQALDFTVSGVNEVMIPLSKMVQGKYQVSVGWSKNQKNYLIKEFYQF